MLLSCSDFQEDLSSFLDGELDEHRHGALASHLAGCLECKRTHDHYRGVGRLLQSATARVQDSAPDLWAALSSKMPSVCLTVEEDLSAYVDGELPPAAQEGVAQHLTSCDACQDKFVAIAKVNSALARGLKLPESMEIDIWSGVKSRLNQDCVLIKGELSAFIDREVATLRHRAITTHLTECGECKQEFHLLSQTGDSLRAHYQPPLPEDFDLWPAIQARMNVVPLEPKDKKRAPAAPIAVRRLYAVAAAMVLMVAASTTMYFYTHQNTPQVQPVTAEAYLIDQSLGEPADVAEAVVYDHNE